MKPIVATAVISAIALATPSLAQGRGGPPAGQTKEAATAVAERAFKRLDQNSDGTFDVAEATTVLQARATQNGRDFRPRAANRTVARNDGNGDGKVSLEEFKAAALTRFDQADTNKNGVIDPNEASPAPPPPAAAPTPAATPSN